MPTRNEFRQPIDQRIDQHYRSMDSPPRIWSDRFRISRATESDMRNDSFSTRDPTMTHLEKEPYAARAPATGGRNDARTCVSGEDAISVDTEVSDQLEPVTRMSKAANPVLAILNGLL